ncbi:hypothetical protein P4S95_16280 [Aneurinibacillus aneurinilyticus]|uniref:hypothetical protein n=1 Tax=Aneurinibacillus aneurinilyticus TaxID=1391 RepID=UPI002E24BFC4|nr:hypothetical protein [Aneurinibacillus aneurinilyticus]
MDILSTIAYAIASYIVVYTILTIIVAILVIYGFHQWRKGQKEYEQMASVNRGRREEMQERFRERWNKRMDR